MKYTGLTYRPPFEAKSLLLQVTEGCSHNKCSFCTMYRDIPFAEESLEQIETDLKEARQYVPDIPRVFLENGDAFCLGTERLLAIADLVHRYLPKVETITMYASVKNIRNKTDEDLVQLRQAGINEMNIGVESGLESTLAAMNKGYTAEEAFSELKRLKAAGMDYGANIIFGAAGPGKARENAEETARLLNETQPFLIFTGTIHAEPGCPLYEDMQAGRFTENTIGEYIAEEEYFLSLLDLKDTYYFGLHPSNVIRMHGFLPRDREYLKAEISRQKEKLGEVLDLQPSRVSGEGGIIF